MAMPHNAGNDPETWVDRYGGYLYRYALSRVRDPSAAEDLVQETFAAALRARDGFRGASSERSWLTGILKHKIVDLFRRNAREHPIGEGDLREMENAAESFFDRFHHWTSAPKTWRDPRASLEEREFWNALNRCVDQLPKTAASAFVLRVLEGHPGADVCKIMGVSSTNLGVILHRARLQLRGCLEKHWFRSENR